MSKSWPGGTEGPNLSSRLWVRMLALLALAAAAGTLWLPGQDARTKLRTLKPRDATQVESLNDIDPTEITSDDLARLNLLCAQGFGFPALVSTPDPKGQDPLGVGLSKIEELAKNVRDAATLELPRYHAMKSEFRGSEAFFRLTILDRVISAQTVDGLPSAAAAPINAPRSRLDYHDPDSLFIESTLLRRHPGSVLNLPFLYVAVGRAAGYPLRLVLAKSHIFVRWQGSSTEDSFNIEPTAQGIRLTQDAYYQSWPVELDARECVLDGYLRSLAPAEEAALYLLIRGACLEERGDAKTAASMRALAMRWTRTPAVLAQVNQLFINHATGMTSRIRAGEFAEIRRAAELAMLEANRGNASFRNTPPFARQGGILGSPQPNLPGVPQIPGRTDGSPSSSIFSNRPGQHGTFRKDAPPGVLR